MVSQIEMKFDTHPGQKQAVIPSLICRAISLSGYNSFGQESTYLTETLTSNGCRERDINRVFNKLLGRTEPTD